MSLIDKLQKSAELVLLGHLERPVLKIIALTAILGLSGTSSLFAATVGTLNEDFKVSGKDLVLLKGKTYVIGGSAGDFEFLIVDDGVVMVPKAKLSIEETEDSSNGVKQPVNSIISDNNDEQSKPSIERVTQASTSPPSLQPSELIAPDPQHSAPEQNTESPQANIPSSSATRELKHDTTISPEDANQFNWGTFVCLGISAFAAVTGFIAHLASKRKQVVPDKTQNDIGDDSSNDTSSPIGSLYRIHTSNIIPSEERVEENWRKAVREFLDKNPLDKAHKREARRMLSRLSGIWRNEIEFDEFMGLEQHRKEEITRRLEGSDRIDVEEIKMRVFLGLIAALVLFGIGGFIVSMFMAITQPSQTTTSASTANLDLDPSAKMDTGPLVRSAFEKAANGVPLNEKETQRMKEIMEYEQNQKAKEIEKNNGESNP